MESVVDDTTVQLMISEDENGDQIYTLHTGDSETTQFHHFGDEEELITSSDQAVTSYLNRGSKEEIQDYDDEMLAEANCVVESYEDVQEQAMEDGEIVIHEETQGEEILTDGFFYGEEQVLPVVVEKSRPKKKNSSLLNLGIITQHMDIREPLNTLKSLLEEKLKVSLMDYKFLLQDTQPLEGHKNLVDQCVQGEGLVQVNLQINTNADEKAINIVDVLKPAEDYQHSLETPSLEDEEILEANLAAEAVIAEDQLTEAVPKEQSVVRWVIDTGFKKDQDRLKIPADPREWSTAHVRHWIQWAVRTFNLCNVRLSDWTIDGNQLCHLSLPEFHQKISSDPGDLFWTHLELLRKCKFVAVIQKPDVEHRERCLIRGRVRPNKNDSAATGSKSSRLFSLPNTSIFQPSTVVAMSSAGNRTGNNGQIQLWQFLLELLTDKDHVDVISWISNDGEFKLKNPEMVAQLWGERKNKPTMNYEKLSRALRYYYDGDMISKVHGKRFVYKFVCDMHNLLGYSTSQLSRLVSECSQVTNQNTHTMFDHDE